MPLDISSLTLCHGTAAKAVAPQFGLGDDRHDYGRVFYLAADRDLARESGLIMPRAKSATSAKIGSLSTEAQAKEEAGDDCLRRLARRIQRARGRGVGVRPWRGTKILTQRHRAAEF